MGIERDYLMRQIMMLLEVIQKIFNFRKKGRFQQAQDEIKYFYDVLALDSGIHELSTEALIDYLINEKKFNNHQIELIAFVLKEQGELSELYQHQHTFFHKAFFLLDTVDRESTSFSMDRKMKIAELKAYLQE